MATVDDMVLNIRALNIETAASVAMAASTKEFEDIQRDQMLRGENAEGKRIGRYARMRYARAKKTMNPLGGTPPDNVDLHLTGAFHRGITMKASGKSYTVTSTDSKADRLQDKYDRNGDVFGLSEGSRETLIEDTLADNFALAVEKQTGLKAVG